MNNYFWMNGKKKCWQNFTSPSFLKANQTRKIPTNNRVKKCVLDLWGSRTGHFNYINNQSINFWLSKITGYKFRSIVNQQQVDSLNQFVGPPPAHSLPNTRKESRILNWMRSAYKGFFWTILNDLYITIA